MNTIRKLLEAQVTRYAHKPLLIWEDEEISYARFDDRVNRLAVGLVRLGIGRGDTVCILMGNRPEFLYAMMALAKIGAVCVPVNTAYKRSELQAVIMHADAGTVITESHRVEVLQEVLPQCPRVQRVVVAEDDPVPGTLSLSGLMTASGPVPPGPGPDDTAAIIYLSGTTTSPRGVMLSNRAYAVAPAARAHYLGWGPQDRVLIVHPLFHINAQTQSFLCGLSAGATVVLRERFSATHFWSEVHRYDITAFCAMATVPMILLSLPTSPLDRGHRVRMVIGRLAGGLYETFEERFGVTLVGGYSTTEDMMSLLNRPDKSRRKVGSCGVPVAPDLHAVRIVDDLGQPLPPGAVGEIIKRSPAVMQGYFKDPEETARTLRDGWLYTGDYGRMDQDGFLFYVDRKNDIIRSAGENISAAEVEAVLNRHPSVAESAVIGVCDPIRQEVLKAYIVLVEGETPQSVPPDAIWQHCLDHLANFKVPRYIEYRTALPKNSSMKVQKHRLKAERADLTAGCFDRKAVQVESAPGRSARP